MEQNAVTFVRFALDVVLKATFLLSMTGVVLLLLRRRSAAGRHLVCTLGLAGILALPLLVLIAPRWQLSLVPSLLPAPPPALEAADFPKGEEPSSKPRVYPQSEPSTPAISPTEPTTSHGETIAEDLSPARASSLASRTASPPRISWALWALIIWAAGAAFGLARLAVGMFRVSWIARRAVRMSEFPRRPRDREVSLLVEIQRPVEVLVSDRVPVAMTTGIFRPCILMSADADRWSPERRRLVLLHELAHVKRADWLALLCGELAAALYWFHPLVWWTVRQTRKESEKACDDIVLSGGTKPSVYAAHLLGIVRSIRAHGRPLLPAMPMASRPSQFEARMRAILDPGARREGFSRWQTRLLTGLIAGTALIVAAVEPWAPAPAEAAILREATLVKAASLSSGIFAADLDSPSSPEEAQECAQSKVKSEAPAIPSAVLEDSDSPSLDSDSPSLDSDSPSHAAGDTFEIAADARGADEEKQSGFVLASKRKPQDGSDWYDRAMELHRDEKYAEAAQAFTKSFELGYREGVSAYNAACAYAQNGEPDHAFAWLDRAMAEGFDLHGYLGRDDDLESLKSDPRFADLQKKALERTRHKKRYEIEAKAEKLDRLMSQPVGDGDALYHLGSELLKLGDYERSARAFQRSAQGTEHPADSLYNLACALSLKEDRGAALENLEKSILAGFSRSAKGIRQDEDLDNLHSEPRFKEILRLADQLHLGLDDDDWEGRIGGKLLRSVERTAWRKRAEHYEAFAKSHPQIGRAWFNLGFAQIKGEIPAEAASAFRKALDLKYRPPTTMYNLACSFALLDQKDEAFGWLFKAIEAGVDDNGSLIRGDDDLDNLRGDPRYRQALRMARKQETEKEE